jgi:hypothetical protein
MSSSLVAMIEQTLLSERYRDAIPIPPENVDRR